MAHLCRLFKFMPESDTGHFYSMSLDKASHMAAPNFKKWASTIILCVWENWTHLVDRTVPDDDEWNKEKKPGKGDGVRVGGVYLTPVVRKGLSGKILRMRERAIWIGMGQLPEEDRARAQCAWHIWGITRKLSWLEWNEQGESYRKLAQRDKSHGTQDCILHFGLWPL